MLEDKFGRRFHNLRLSITDVCNFKCKYCLPDGIDCDAYREFLSLTEIQKLVNRFASSGTSKVRITGGEPALRKDLPEIIKACASAKGIEHVAVTSNGHKLETDIQKWVNVGLDSLNIRIDSLHPRMFAAISGHNKLESILRGIHKAIGLGVKVKTNAVLMKRYNEQKLQIFLILLKTTSVTLRMIELMQTGDNVTFFNQNHVSVMPIKQHLIESGWGQLIRDKTAGPAQEFSHLDSQGRIGLIMPYGKDFCATCNRLRVSAIGNLHLCLFAEQGLDIRDALRSADSNELQAQLFALLGDKEATLATRWLQRCHLTFSYVRRVRIVQMLSLTIFEGLYNFFYDNIYWHIYKESLKC
jgi:cyclic pyranopterin phosphate synthase